MNTTTRRGPAAVGPSTPALGPGSRLLAGLALAGGIAAAACGTGRAEAPPGGPVGAAPATAPKPVPTAPEVTAERCLGVEDRGIWGDLDDRVQLELPAGTTADRVTATVDRARALLVLAVDGWPVKPYPLAGTDTLTVGSHALALRPGDRAELAPLLRADALREAAPAAAHDRDRDGLVDTLDVLIGARKTVLNADAYVGGYESIRYPMGDVPRDHGVCTDVIVRSLRNAGLDLQQAMHQDIARAPRSYPMVKGKGDSNIDHRRVKTMLPYLRRHLDERTAKLDDPRDPWRPGDLVLMDTFPSRSGPDHIGIVSERIAPSGLPYVINNWTDGTVTAEMDLLAWIPVTHRFRVAPRR